MIDFRYHLVSLIAVFMALAVGIVIGAGPLRDYLAEELSGQVDQLRIEKEEMREALEASEAQRAEIGQFIDASAPLLLDGVLEGRGVAIVQTNDADGDVVERVIADLERAGAQITSRVELTETWTDPTQRAFRAGIAGNIAAYLNPQPADDAGAEIILGTALGQALTLRNPEATSQTSIEAQAMYDLFLSSGLIGQVTDPVGPAYAIVVLTGTEAEQDDPDGATQANSVLTISLTGLAQTGEGIVVAGGAYTDTALVSEIRGSDALSAALGTVDGTDTPSGALTVPLALASAIAGSPGAFGVAQDADAILPAGVTLPPPDPEQFAPGSPDAPQDPDAADPTQGEEQGGEGDGDEQGEGDAPGTDADDQSEEGDGEAGDE